MSSADEVAMQFQERRQQREAGRLGMWIFLGTEVLFLGALFTAYTVTRLAHPDAFAAASEHTKIVLGTLNTAVLLTSSWSMATAVHAARQGRARELFWMLIVTAVFGAVFLGVKAYEYTTEYHEQLLPVVNFHFPGPLEDAAELFFWLYYVMTGIHALHLFVAVCVVSVIAWRARRGHFSAEYFIPVELTGLYWHFVDIVWIVLYPLFYLISRA